MGYWDNDTNASQRYRSDYGKYKLYGLLVVAVLAGGLYLIVNPTIKTPAISGKTVARLDARTIDLIDRLNAEPCNQLLANNLAARLLGRAEYSAVIAFVKYSEQKCGRNDDILMAAFRAYRDSSDFKNAEETANRLLENNPASPELHMWRGEAKKGRGDFKGAYADLKKGLNLFPDPSIIIWKAFFDVAWLAAKTGEPCEAVAVLRDYVAYDSANRRTPEVTTLMQEWQQQGACSSPYGNGYVRMRYNPHAGAIILPVKINGIETRMVIDTGASRTVLTKAFAKRANIEASARDGAVVQTANGEIWQMGGRAGHISLGEADARNVPVFIQTTDNNNFGNGVEGLLGLSFLGNFKFSIHKGILELRPLQ